MKFSSSNFLPNLIDLHDFVTCEPSAPLDERFPTPPHFAVLESYGLNEENSSQSSISSLTVAPDSDL
jgi:hypothetical protein